MGLFRANPCDSKLRTYGVNSIGSKEALAKSILVRKNTINYPRVSYRVNQLDSTDLAELLA